MTSADESNHTLINSNILARSPVFEADGLYPGIKRLYLKNLLGIYQEKFESSLAFSNTDFPDAGLER